jgi:hypothetical protein
MGWLVHAHNPFALMVIQQIDIEGIAAFEKKCHTPFATPEPTIR